MGCASSVGAQDDEQPVPMSPQEKLLYSQLARPPSAGSEKSEPGRFACFVTRKAIAYKATYNDRKRSEDAASPTDIAVVLPDMEVLEDEDAEVSPDVEPREARIVAWLDSLRAPSPDDASQAYTMSPKAATCLDNMSMSSLRSALASSNAFNHHFGGQHLTEEHSHLDDMGVSQVDSIHNH